MSNEYRRNIEEAGFVLIDGQLRTRCCDICVIPHPTDDLFETHLKASPNCPNIRLMYGEETVREYVRIANVATSDIRQEYALTYGVNVRGPDEVFPSDSQRFRKQFSQNSGRRYDTVGGIPLEKPRYPYYADEHNNCNRERTYSNPTAHAKEIRAGFFYDNDIRRHTCYQCGVQLILQEGDDPELQHAALSPYCMHINCLKGRAFVKEVQANSRRTQQDPDNRAEYQEIYCREAIVNVRSDDASNDFGIQRIQERRMASSMNYQEQESTLSTEEATDSMGINLLRPKLYQYAMLEKRLDSYKTWPSSNPLSPKILAEAGLFYTGKGDSVRCYYCGGGLRNWEEGDSVWVEHVKWYPTCPHVHLVKGASYVKGVKEKRIFTDDGVVMEEMIPAPVVSREDLLLTSIAAESCLANGFDKELVKTAIRIYIDQFRHTDFKAQDLVEILFDIEENGVPPNPSPVCSEVLEENHDGTMEYEQTKLDLQASDGGPQNMIIGEEPEDVKTEAIIPAEVTDELIRENERLKELKQCKICLDANSSVIFLPCGHMVSCPQCAPALLKCPICRTRIKGTVKAYFA